MHIHEALAARMKDLDLDTGRDLAKALDVDQSTASRWLSGAAVPGDQRAQRLAEFLDQPVRDVRLMLIESREPSTPKGFHGDYEKLTPAQQREIDAHIRRILNETP